MQFFIHFRLPSARSAAVSTSLAATGAIDLYAFSIYHVAGELLGRFDLLILYVETTREMKQRLDISYFLISRNGRGK